jgi:hypothetical protein
MILAVLLIAAVSPTGEEEGQGYLGRFNVVVNANQTG